MPYFWKLYIHWLPARSFWKKTVISKAFLWEWGMLPGDFGRKFAKLEVAVTDVRTGGEIV